MDNHVDLNERLALKGVSRRDFMKFCGLMATVLGLPMSFAPRIAEAMEKKRPTVVWMHFAECTGMHRVFHQNDLSVGRRHYSRRHRLGVP